MALTPAEYNKLTDWYLAREPGQHDVILYTYLWLCGLQAGALEAGPGSLKKVFERLRDLSCE